MKNFLFCWAFCVFFATYAFCQNLDFKRSSAENASQPIHFDADNLGVDENGWITASGNVRVRHGDTQLTADKVRVNKDSGDIIAVGNVSLIRENQGATYTEAVTYNYKTGVGLTDKIDVRAGVGENYFRVIASSAERLVGGAYNLHDVQVTTCTNAEDHLHYRFFGKEGEWLPDKYVELHGMSIWLGNVPIFYFPWWKRNLERHYGWRFTPGYESEWGAYLLSRWHTRLLSFGGPDRLDSHMHIDYRTKRGWALGEDLAWYFGDVKNGAGHNGLLGIYGIFDDEPMDEDWDRDPDREVVEKNRFRAQFTHDSYISDADSLSVRANYFSDSYVFEDFYEEEYEDLVTPENYISYYHNTENTAFGLLAYQRLNDFYESVNRTPEAIFDVYRIEILNSGIFYESQTSASFLTKDFADYGDETPRAVGLYRPAVTNITGSIAPSSSSPYGNNESYDSGRIDTMQALYVPGKYFGFLNFIPRARYRGTYYSKTYTKFYNTEVVGGITNKSSWVRDDGGKLRNIFELGAESSFKLYGIFESPDGTRYRHVVEPYFDYTFVPEPNLLKSNIFQFDEIDSLGEANNLRFGIRQQLQSKAGEKTVNLIDLDTYAIYDFYNNDEGGELTYAGMTSKFRPSDSFRIQLDALYDIPESELKYIDLWALLWNGRIFEIEGEVYHRPNDCTLFIGSLIVEFTRRWSGCVYTRFDSETSRVEEISSYIQYTLDCLAFRLKGTYEPGFTREDGTERVERYKVSFYSWLRASADDRERYEERVSDTTW